MNAKIPLTSRRIVYTVPGMDQIRRNKDVIYKQADGIDYLMDVYTPPELSDDEKRPGLIFIHGGPVKNGSGQRLGGLYLVG